jgi:hypothetical protein
MHLIAFEVYKKYLSVKSTLMKKLLSGNESVLFPLQKKFKEAGCECSLTKDKHKTTLIIRYTNIVAMPQHTRPTG